MSVVTSVYQNGEIMGNLAFHSLYLGSSSAAFSHLPLGMARGWEAGMQEGW